MAVLVDPTQALQRVLPLTPVREAVRALRRLRIVLRQEETVEEVTGDEGEFRPLLRREYETPVLRVVVEVLQVRVSDVQHGHSPSSPL